MKKVKAFFSDFSRSLLPQHSYYQKIRKARFSNSFKYFAALIFLLSFSFFCLFLVTGVSRPSPFSFKDFISALKTYPPDLTVEIKNGNLATNLNRPSFFFAQDGERKSLVAVISEGSTKEEIQKFETPLMFTDRYLVVRNKERGDKPDVFPYGNMSMSVNKVYVNALIFVLEKMAPFLIVFFLLFLLLVSPLFAIVGTFFYLAFVSIFCYFVFWLFSKKHTYKKTLQLSLHAATLPLSTKYLLLGFGYNLDRAWPVFTLLVAIFILSALNEAYVDK